MFNIGGNKRTKEVVKINSNNPPNSATLNFGTNPEASTETEKAIVDKFDNGNKLPTYSKNPELTLEETLLKLKGKAQEFKKDVAVVPQKPQPIPFATNAPTIPPEFLEKHLEELGVPPVMGQKIPKLPDKIIPVTNQSKMNCKFLSSSQCHSDYPNFSGASINFPDGKKMKCDSLGSEKSARAVSTISGGKITGVYMIEEGEGYMANPKIMAIGGGGEGAKFKAVVIEGKIKEIKVISGGEGYHETPVIKIESPNLSNGCYLCCK